MNKVFGHAEGNTAYLVPARADTMSNLRTATWLRMRLGDPSKLPSVKADLESLFARVSDTTQKAQMLAADRTRTKAQQHMAAKTLAQGLSSDLRRYAEIFGKKGACQSAPNVDPQSAPKNDPLMHDGSWPDAV